MFSKMSSNRTAQNSPSSSVRQRETSVSSAREPPAKKTKNSPSVSRPKITVPRKQKSLQGFFQPRCGGESSSRIEHAHETSPVDNRPAWPRIETSFRGVVSNDKESLGPMAQSKIQGPFGSQPRNDDSKVGRGESRESWAKIFSKPQPPLCDGHGEECVQLTTKKPGVNYGRAFWICQRCVVQCLIPGVYLGTHVTDTIPLFSNF